MTGQTPGAQPVQGPSQPTHTDLIWATASSQAALDDSSLSVRDRLSYLEAEAATYTAAAHLGVDGGHARGVRGRAGYAPGRRWPLRTWSGLPAALGRRAETGGAGAWPPDRPAEAPRRWHQAELAQPWTAGATVQA